MRRGTWLLAISGMMALVNGASFGADPAFGTNGRPTTEGAAGEFQTRSGRIAATPANGGLPGRYTSNATSPAKGKPETKNYQKELFSESQVAPDSTLGAWAEEPAEVAAPPRKAVIAPTTAAKTSAPKSNSTVPASPNSKKVIPVSASREKDSSEPATAGPRVIQATYDKAAGTSEKKFIQQVRSEAKAPRGSSASPMPDFEAKSPTPASAPAKAGGAPFAPSGRAVATTENSGPATPQVTIEWIKKGDINVGQECQVELHVKNGGSVTASQIAVDAVFPTTVRLTNAEPKPVAAADKLTWSFDSIAPGSERKIIVKLIPSRRGDLGASAQVRFTGAATASFRVEEPMLKVALKGPTELMLGDPASQFITVSNPGTGTAHDVKVEARLSDGLEHGSRGEKLIMEVGSIGPGETRTVRLGLDAIKGGPQTINVTATSNSEAGGTATAQVNVIAPSLKIAVDGPGLRYKGRNAKYTLTVSNDGSIANNNIRISQVVADGFKFVSADRSGKYDASTKSVQWFIGRLEPGANAKVTCELNATTLGNFAHTVAVLSDSGVRAEAKIETKVDGVAALTMELVDLDDPVETGVETMYEIRLKNEGSKPASGVSIVCELPAGMELITAKAPVDAIVEGRQILFKSLEQVAPGGQATYKIHVKGVQEGSHRMRVRMTGGGLTEPVIREEVTKVYSDEN